MVNEQDLTTAYDTVIYNTEKAVHSGIALETEKAKLDGKVLNATFAGQIQGKNEGERKAVAMQMFQDDFASVDARELDYKENSLKLSLSRLRLDMLRDIIRIEELAKK